MSKISQKPLRYRKPRFYGTSLTFPQGNTDWPVLLKLTQSQVEKRNILRTFGKSKTYKPNGRKITSRDIRRMR